VDEKRGLINESLLSRLEGLARDAWQDVYSRKAKETVVKQTKEILDAFIGGKCG
jgi:hypothetical protein